MPVDIHQLTFRSYTMAAKKTASVAAFNKAVAALETAFVKAHEAVVEGTRKAGELLKVGINQVLDAGRAADVDNGDLIDTIKEKVDAAVEAGHLSKSTGRVYLIGVRFAVDRRVAWTPSLQNKEEQVKALQAAGKPIPKALQAEADKQAAAAAERGTKASKANVASKETVVKKLAAALADMRTLGMPLAADALDLIHKIDPAYKEPEAAPV
jgi:hypothetical protein